MMRGTRKDDVEAEIRAEDENGPSFFLTGSDDKSVRIRVDQDSGRCEFIEQAKCEYPACLSIWPVHKKQTLDEVV